MQDQKRLVSRKRAKNAALIIVLICIIGMFLHIPGLSSNSQGLSRLVYQFRHGGVMHLIINCWALIQIVFYYQPKLTYMLEAYLVSVFLWPVCSATPIVGMSGLCMALAGRISFTTARPLYFLTVLYLSCMLGFFIPHISVYTHLYCLTLGAVISLLNYPVEWK